MIENVKDRTECLRNRGGSVLLSFLVGSDDVNRQASLYTFSCYYMGFVEQERK